MKFRNDSDKMMFLLEAGCSVPGGTEVSDFQPGQDQLEAFFLKRNRSISGLKDFRKSQVTKSQWRHNRYNMMKGIKTFHKSTSGKLFHRQLGRFLATRISLTKASILSMRENNLSLYEEISEVSKALSSFKTHAFILLENFMSTSTYVDYIIFLEEVIPHISKIETSIISLQEIPSDSLDMLAACIPEKIIPGVLEGKHSFEKLHQNYCSSIKSSNTKDFPFLEAIQKLKSL